MRFVIGMAIVASALLGGCGQSEEQAKANLRTKFVGQCNTQMGTSLKEKGIDPARFCACSADSMMKGRTAAELTKMDKDGVGADEAGAKAAAECIAQQQPAAVAQPAAPAAEPATAPAEEEAPAEEATE